MESKGLFEHLLGDVIAIAESANNSMGTWREKPYSLVDFFINDLGERPFPGKQTEALETIDAILNKDDLPAEDKLKKITEIVLLFGKGSGKDFLVSGIVAYIPYWLNCMYDPQGYFNFGQGENIDIINLAKNAAQAENVFFSKLKARLKSSKWFVKVDRVPQVYNEYQEKKSSIIFYNNIRAFSGHSEAGSFEGYNPLIAIFDEVGDYEYDLADFAYSTLKSSSTTRFGARSMMIFISFPRHSADYMMEKFNQGQDDEYQEVYSIRGSSWEVNPNIKRESLDMEYRKDPEAARMRFECIPPANRGGFFKYPERIDDCVKKGKTNNVVLEEKIISTVLDNGEDRHFIGYDLELFAETLELDASKTYYLGMDGGIENDMYTLSLFHAEVAFDEAIEGGEVVMKPRNKPVEDLLITFKPDSKAKIPVSVQNVIDLVEIICSRVFVKSALSDKFNSGAMIQTLQMMGVEAEDKVYSNPFQLALYTQFKNLAYTGLLELLDLDEDNRPKKENPNDNMKNILLINGVKIDHESDREKDTCDARATAVWLCANDEVVEETNFAMPVIQGVQRM